LNEQWYKERYKIIELHGTWSRIDKIRLTHRQALSKKEENPAALFTTPQDLH
jgi:hypothetical protein